VTAAAGINFVRARFFPLQWASCLPAKDNGGDAKKCMDVVAKMIDAKTKDAGLL
jgi:hypothetical protein